MSKFIIGDKVIVMGEVCVVTRIEAVKTIIDGSLFYIYHLSNGNAYADYHLQIWNPKNDLEGSYMKQELCIDKKYRTICGRDVKIIAINPELRLMQAVGLVKGIDRFVQWSLDGKSWSCSEEIDCRLVEINPYEDFKVDESEVIMNEFKKGRVMHQVSLDKKYRTRNNLPVEIFKIKDGVVYGLMQETNLLKWFTSGRFLSECTESCFDLIEVSNYTDFKIDDVVLVSNNGDVWLKSYFCKVSDNGKAIVFDDGKTSYTATLEGKIKWDKCVKWEDRTPEMVIL